METKDKEQRPPIPVEIKREVRQRCGFGCVVCGIPLYEYEYDHMIEWSDVHRHVAEEITLLCNLHHGEKTRGLLPKDAVVEANKKPYNKRSGISTNYLLHYSGANVYITIGGSRFEYENLVEGSVFVPLLVDGIPMIAFKLEQGKLFLNFIAFNEFNKPIIQIRDNELVHDTQQWDIEWVAQNLTIKQSKGEILLQLVFRPPNGISISKGRILRNGLELLVGDGYIFNTNNAIFLGSASTHNSTVGFSIGYPLPDTPAGFVFDRISRYQFDRDKSLTFLNKCLSERKQLHP